MPKTFYVGIKGVIVSESKVLLIKQKDVEGQDYWGIPGGRMDDNETIEQALVREIREEISPSARFNIKELLFAQRYEKDMKDGNGLMVLFYKVESEPFEVKINAESSEYKWFSKEELENFPNIGNMHLQVSRMALS